MATASSSFQAVMTGTPEQRVEALRQFLGYPLKQRDPEKNLFWYLRPGADDEAASETRPVAVGFYSELNDGNDSAIKAWVATRGNEVSQHFFGWFEDSNQPVMYLLLPETQQSGRVALVLPSESRQWRQRQVLTHPWDSPALLTPLGRLQQGELELMQKVEDKPMFSVPLVEWAFYKPIATAKELAQELARVSREMEQAIPAVYAAEGADGYLKTLYESFKRELLPTLKVSADNAKDYSFADIYAQTIAYGLFTARVFSHVRDPKADFNRQDAWDKLPETNPFLRQLFQGISEQPVEALGDDLADKISEVFSILRAAKMDAILSDFRQKMNREDIVIRFYEDFLATYKPEMRERRGVYYTPEPVVSYMVRSVDILLREKFDKPLGLADPEVMILDPACGTGTFLLSIFQLIYKRFTGEEKDENPAMLPIHEALMDKFGSLGWSDYVKNYLLPRIFGFELLMAPYAIAHLKLGLFLEETGYLFDGGKRIGIYLTNSLDSSLSKANFLFEEFIADESNEANLVKKDKKIVAIIGNPPYSNASQNMSDKIRAWSDRYRTFNGQPIKEKGALQFEKNIQDDYIKFFSFSQSRIDETGYGILAFVANHSYLDGPTLRGMRQSMSRSFDDISILNLHGSSKRKEACPDGSKDENVFDIQQGTAIGFFVKSTSIKNSLYQYSDLWGVRHSIGSFTGKYDWLKSNDFNSTPWNTFKPNDSFFMFKPQDNRLLSEYELGVKITDIFNINSTGIITARDHLTIQFQKDVLWDIVQDFSRLPIEVAREKYDLRSDTNDWKVHLAQEDVRKNISESTIKKITYRPFDVRYTYYTGNARGFLCNPRRPVMRNLIDSDNIAFHVCKQLSTEKWAHVCATNLITDDSYVSNKTRERGYTFPLYVLPDDNVPVELSEARRPNFKPDFLRRLPEEIRMVDALPGKVFHYIYAILHSPTYRSRYIEFLKIDFPSVQFTGNVSLFEKLANYGQQLFGLHLLQSERVSIFATKFDENGDRTIDSGHPKYASGKVTINRRGAGFTGVPQEVWEFYIGGYQVCHKWLKDRKGRTLSDDDILHYQKIIVALQETIRIMQQIDDAIPSWPIE